MNIPLLTYHSVNILGNDYSNNDHVALESDLVTITEQGYHIVPLTVAFDAALNGRELLSKKLVALTFDDGAIFDFEDFDHPTCGPQKSFYRIFREFMKKHPGAQPDLHGSSFVIASPEGRQAMDQAHYGGRDWWHDNWWASANDSGLFSIENHTWDHNHPGFPSTVQKDGVSGNFMNIDTAEECDLEIRVAADYIKQRALKAAKFLAYPWGQSSDFLRQQYLPQHGSELGLTAALGTGPGYLSKGSYRWNVPRLVCGDQWTSPDGLAKILSGAIETCQSAVAGV